MKPGELTLFGMTLKGLSDQLDDAPLPLNQAYYLALRPEALVLADEAASHTLSGTVHILENLGNEFLIIVRPLPYGGLLDPEANELGDRQLVVRVSADQGRSLKPGDRIYLQPLWHRALLFSAAGFRLRLQAIAAEAMV